MINVVPYKPEHLEMIKPRSAHAGEVPSLVMTHAETVIWKDHPIAIFGIFCFVPGVFHVWGLVSDEVTECALSFHKATLKLIESYEMKLDARRIQMDVRSDFTIGQKWAEALGFHREGLMKNYCTQGEDCYLYARYR